MRNAESVKARLKNIAKETGRTMQDVLIAYSVFCHLPDASWCSL